MSDANPFKSPAAPRAKPAIGQPRSWLRSIAAGALWSLGSAFPITALMALCFRFPVPFGSIDGGPAQVLPAMMGLLFYGIMGGFVVLGICGGLAGIAARILAPGSGEQRRLQRFLSVGVTFVLLFILATLDWYVGPW